MRSLIFEKFRTKLTFSSRKVVLARGGKQGGGFPLKQSQLEHINEEEDAHDDGKDQRFVHKFEIRQDKYDRHDKYEYEDHGHWGEARVVLIVVVSVDAGFLVGLDSFGEDQEHHGCHEETHDDN